MSQLRCPIRCKFIAVQRGPAVKSSIGSHQITKGAQAFLTFFVEFALQAPSHSHVSPQWAATIMMSTMSMSQSSSMS